jgi:RIO kinase 1
MVINRRRARLRFFDSDRSKLVPLFSLKVVHIMDQEMFEFFDELDDNDGMIAYLSCDAHRSRHPKGRIGKKLEAEENGFIRAQDSSRDTFRFTYKAARFEEWWLLESLTDFYEHQWVSDVLRRVKGGKEASVYQCRGGNAVPATLAAAKVYRPRSLRNLHNDHVYRQGRADLDSEGRQMIDDGMLHAIEKKTEYGRELLHQSWIAYEFTSMQQLHAGGADVPKPYTMANNAILMEFIGDMYSAAPALNEIALERSEALALFDRVLFNIDILLSHDLIHGDLSAYNILYWDGGIRLIDFPQVISPRINRQAFPIFSRDVTRICDYFRQQGVGSDPQALAHELWSSHGYSLPRPEDER